MDVPGISTRTRFWNWWLIALIVIVVTGVYQGARHGGFLNWDDDINIVQNPHVQQLTADELKWAFTDASYMRRYVPFAWLGWLTEREFFGLTAKSAHVGNILLHALNAVLVFFLLRKIGVLVWSRQVPPLVLAGGACAGALIWAVHPLRVEVVAWASGRMYCQAAFFLLLTLITYLRACSDRSRPGPRAGWLAVSALAFGASLLTYPIGIMLPLLLLVLDKWLLGRFQNGGALSDRRNRAVWVEKLPFIVIAGLVGIATLAARYRAEGIWEPPPSIAQFSIGARFAQACYVWMYYVWKPLLPTNLVPVYTTLVGFNPLGLPFIVSMLGLVTASAFVVWQRRRWPWLFGLWAAHLLLLLPVLGVTERPHYASDRYSYLPGLLWSIAIMGGVVSWWPTMSRRVAIASAAGLALVGALALSSVVQVRIWRDNETFFKTLYEAVGDSVYRADIAMRLGDFLRTKSRFDEATVYYRQSLQLIPNNHRAAIPHLGLGTIAHAKERWQEAANHYQAALQLDPQLAEASRAFGELLLQRRMPTEAATVLEQATQRDPSNADLHDLLGVTYFHLGKFSEAVNAFGASARLRPRSVSTLCTLAAALCAVGRAREAIDVAQQAVKLAPALADAHLKLGEALRMSEQVPQAIASLREAARLQPRSVAILNSLASAYARGGQLPLALDTFRAATEVDPNSPEAHHNHGLALRDIGRTDDAVSAFRRALQLRPDYAAARQELERLVK